MISNETMQSGNCLYHKVDKTIYEISVKQSDSAKESVEDILARLIATDMERDEEEENG